MPRVLVLARRPDHLGWEEADRWLRSEVRSLAEVPGIERVEITRLASLSLSWTRDWDWLVELSVGAAEGADRAVRRGPLRDLLADLRFLGMHPSVIVPDAPVSDEPPAT